jgi:hypothetical protein
MFIKSWLANSRANLNKQTNISQALQTAHNQTPATSPEVVAAEYGISGDLKELSNLDGCVKQMMR